MEYDETNGNVLDDSQEVSPDQNQQTPQEQSAPQFDPNQIANAAAQAAVAAQKASQPDPNDPENMTPEQRSEYFKSFNITDDFTGGFVQAITPDEEGKISYEAVGKMFEQFRDGIMQQAVRHVELTQNQFQQNLNQQLAPVSQFYQQQQAEQVWNNFATKYPHLKDHRQLVDSAASQIAANPQYGAMNVDQLFDATAKAVEATIKQINPNVNFGQTSSTTPQQTPPVQGMSGVAMTQGMPNQQQTGPKTGEFYSDVLD